MKIPKICWFNVLVLLLLVAGGSSLVALLANAAWGGEADITWQKPETNCDGSQLTDLVGFRAYWGPHRAEIPGAQAASYSVAGLPPGDWWIAMTAVNAEGTESPVAGPVVKTVTPADFKTTSDMVYTFIRAEGSVLVLPTLHKVPVGTVCDATQSVNGKYVIPREAVTWSGNARLVAVLADCG